MDTAVRPVLSEEIDRFAALLTLSMCADPSTRWATPDCLQYLNVMTPLVAEFAGRAAVNEDAADVIGDFDGASCWLPPHVAADEAAAQEIFSKFVPADRLKKVAALFEAMAGHHPKAPHWYLWIVGVDPVRRGAGLGRKLLAHGLERVDQAHGLAYLEATSERSLGLYREFGFEVRGEVSVFDSPKMYPMIREPR